METPSSSRRLTRSQTSAASNGNINDSISRIIENSEKGLSESSRPRTATHQDRYALVDITNDSPIIGLATGKLETPSLSIVKRRGSRVKNTPGSGEALLRGQVKSLLQRVEEEVDASKISLETRPFLHLINFIRSPTGLVAPTPANTPQVLNISNYPSVEQSTVFGSETPTSTIEEQMISKVVSDIFYGKYQDSLQSEKCQLTRSLLLDFTEKSEISHSQNDDGSVWSIQANASIHEEEVYYDEIDVEIYSDDEEALVDDLCAGMSKMNVNDNILFPKFVGQHTRFIYNSDDELVEEPLCGLNEDVAASIVSEGPQL